MKLLLSCLAIILAGSIVKAQTVITVQRGSTTLLESRLDSAIAHAQNDDVIYLPGGLIPGTQNVNIIGKRLSIFGAGYHPDSSIATSQTIIAEAIVFVPGSEGSLLTGIHLNKGIGVEASNITITRCNFWQLAISKSSILIEECIIRDNCFGNSSSDLTNILIRKNILYSQYLYGFSGTTFSNNIVFVPIFYATAGLNNLSCLFENNIFINFSGTDDNNLFNNNLFVNGPIINGLGNVFYEPLSNIFANYTAGLDWSPSQNFHLKSGSKGIGLGTDGKDAGLYGTSSPFKDGGFPINPHIQRANVGTSTSTNGKLYLTITVQAQKN